MKIKALYQITPLRFILTVISFVLIPLSAIGQSYILMYNVTALSKRQFWLWLWLTVFELIILGIGTLGQSFAMYLSTKQIQEYNHKVRSDIIKHYYYDDQNYRVAAMQNRLITDIKNTDDNYLMKIFNCIQMFSYILFSIIVLLLIHWSLLLVTIVLGGISIYLPKLLERKMQVAFSDISDSNKKYLDVIGKWLVGLNVLQRYLAGGKLFKVMNDSAKAVEAAKVRQTKANQELAVMNGLVSNILLLVLFSFTAVLITNKLIVFGAITTVENLQYYMTIGLQYLGNYRGQIKSTKPINEQIVQDSVAIKNDKQNNTETPASFAAEDLSLKFPNGESLIFPDFEIKKVEKILLTGDSGTGKSTLFKLILGELKPTTGKINYFDKNNQKISPDLSKIGYISQKPRLFPATIADNITMFNSKLSNRVEQMISEVDLTKDIKKFEKGIDQKINLDHLNISGGQRQKIVLARVKIHKSDIILIDEGTSAIDQNATISILEKLLKSKATIVFIAHNFSEEMLDMFNREIRLQK